MLAGFPALRERKNRMGSLRWCKAVETPSTVEVWEYSSPVGRMLPDGSEDAQEERKGEREGRSTAEYYDAAKRRERHYKGVRWEIARLIDCNFDASTKFLTLTFAQNVTDIKAANREFSKFMRRLNRSVYKSDSTLLRYLAVWERQKRGAIHYHVVLFGFPYMPKRELQAVWGHGFVKVNRIAVDQRMNVGRYISKYFSKDVEDGYKLKKYFRSQNLKLPEESRWVSEEPFSAEGCDVAFSKGYDQLIPDGAGGVRPRKVRYWKIRKEGGSDAIDM